MTVPDSFLALGFSVFKASARCIYVSHLAITLCHMDARISLDSKHDSTATECARENGR